jgi:hypothetical protein
MVQIGRLTIQLTDHHIAHCQQRMTFSQSIITAFWEFVGKQIIETAFQWS